jgi:hypothetical protein
MPISVVRVLQSLRIPTWPVLEELASSVTTHDVSAGPEFRKTDDPLPRNDDPSGPIFQCFQVGVDGFHKVWTVLQDVPKQLGRGIIDRQQVPRLAFHFADDDEAQDRSVRGYAVLKNTDRRWFVKDALDAASSCP